MDPFGAALHSWIQTESWYKNLSPRFFPFLQTYSKLYSVSKKQSRRVILVKKKYFLINSEK